jgi:hypothetical protein
MNNCYSSLPTPPPKHPNGHLDESLLEKRLVQCSSTNKEEHHGPMAAAQPVESMQSTLQRLNARIESAACFGLLNDTHFIARSGLPDVPPTSCPFLPITQIRGRVLGECWMAWSTLSLPSQLSESDNSSIPYLGIHIIKRAHKRADRTGRITPAKRPTRRGTSLRIPSRQKTNERRNGRLTLQPLGNTEP